MDSGCSKLPEWSDLQSPTKCVTACRPCVVAVLSWCCVQLESALASLLSSALACVAVQPMQQGCTARCLVIAQPNHLDTQTCTVTTCSQWAGHQSQPAVCGDWQPSKPCQQHDQPATGVPAVCACSCLDIFKRSYERMVPSVSLCLCHSTVCM